MMKRTRLEERYDLGPVLGRGGMGVVYQARDRLLERDVAVKTILDIDNQVALDLFYRECSVQSKIVHPNIVEVFDMGEFDDDGVMKPFYVMPLLPGEPLRSLIDSGSARLTVERAIDIIRSACRGLQAAHDNGLIHRDLKPGNVFVMPDDSVKLIDFGIAHVIGVGTMTMLKGTLHYMAPEQLDMKQPTAMSDVYSLGVVCYEALTRRLPFAGASQSELTEAIRNETAPPASEANSAVPEAVSQVLHKSMAKQPWHRFSSAQQFGDALGKALSDGVIELHDLGEVARRLARAQKAFEEADYDFALEVVRDLEGEGVVDSDIRKLRKRVEQAVRTDRVGKLLGAAKRFTSEGEHPVALRKIQEALDLDPDNTDALALQAEVENERRGKQIDNWARLAREHLANNSFGQAHEAVENILQLNPDNADALELKAATQRAEQEAERERERKEELYRVASEAWDKGEVTQALTRLESLIALEEQNPGGDGERGAAYRKLYQEVRSEQQSIENAHKRARAAISDSRFDEAEEIVAEFAGKHPGNALFQALKVDIEQRRRQQLSEAIAETDRQVEAEPDLQKKIGLLEKTLNEFPGEEHFERALKLVQEKTDLVEGIVRKARYFEDQGQYIEALSQWRMLESIHKERPGLTLEIERLEKLRDEQSTTESKSRWSSEIERYMDSGDSEKAVATCEQALAEFPEDKDLIELKGLAERRVARAGRARKLFVEAQGALADGRREEGLDQLREVRRMDPANAVAKTVLVNSLIEEASQTAEEDWAAAASLVDEVAQQDPDHPALEGLRRTLEAGKREQFVRGFLDRARELNGEGKRDEALETVERALALYPNELKLKQLASTLRRSDDDTGEVEAPPPDSPVVVAASPESEPPPAEQPTELIAETPPPPATEAPTVVEAPAAVDAPTVVEASEPPQRASDAVSKKKLLLFGAAAAALLVVALLVLVFSGGESQPSPAPLTANLAVSVTPVEAELFVDGASCGFGSCQPALEAGEYRLTARMLGFAPETMTVRVGEDGTATPPAVRLTLNPLAVSLSLTTNRPRGTVFLDGKQVGEFVDGEFEIAALEPGEHELQVRDGATSATLRFRSDPGRLPAITETNAVNLRLAAAAILGEEVWIYADRQDAALAVDGESVASVTSEAGVLLAGLEPGFHDVAVGPEDDSNGVAFEVGPQPRLAASFASDLPTGIVYVIAGVDDATVYVNGRPYERRKTRRGLLRLDPMPGRLKIGVRKDGFIAPDDKEVRVRKGATSRVRFELKPEPARAVLRLSGGIPGSSVDVDGEGRGRIADNGILAVAGLTPGSHRITVSREGYREKVLSVTLEAGQSSELDAGLERVTGALRVSVEPADGVQLTLRREGAESSTPIEDATADLAPGSYVVRAEAGGYQPSEQTVQVRAGAEASVEIRLQAIQQQAAAARPSDYLSVLGEMEGWSPRPDGVVRRGGGFAYGPVRPGPGVYRFRAQRQSGGRIAWFFTFGDGQPYWMYELGRRRFERFLIDGEERESEQEHAVGARRGEDFDVEITVSRSSIVTELSVGGQVVATDRLESNDLRLDQGRWGFYLGRSDQVSVASLDFGAQ